MSVEVDSMCSEMSTKVNILTFFLQYVVYVDLKVQAEQFLVFGGH